MHTPHRGPASPGRPTTPDTTATPASPTPTPTRDAAPLSLAPDNHVAKTLAPGQPGTIHWQRIHGEQLVCVRYRESADGTQRYTTIELVVDARTNRRCPTNRNPTVGVAINFNDATTRQKICAAGGRWDPERKIWLIPRETARALKLRYS